MLGFFTPFLRLVQSCSENASTMWSRCLSTPLTMASCCSFHSWVGIACLILHNVISSVVDDFWMLANCRWRCCSVRPFAVDGKNTRQTKEARCRLSQTKPDILTLFVREYDHAHKKSTVTCPSNAPGVHTLWRLCRRRELTVRWSGGLALWQYKKRSPLGFTHFGRLSSSFPDNN